MSDISKITLPTGSTYNIKDQEARRVHNPDALDSKTYTNVIGTAVDAEHCSFFYMTVRGTTFNAAWHIKVRVVATVDRTDGYLYYTDSIFDLWGQQNTYTSYESRNRIYNTSYRPFYNHSYFIASSTGYNNGCSSWIGFNLYNSASATSTAHKRIITVELLQYENCVAELQDTLTTPTDIPNRADHTSWYTSTNTSFTNFDACNQGLKQSGDANTTSISTLQLNSGHYQADSAVYRYQMLFQKDENILTPLNNNSNTTGTTKTMLTNVEFDAFGKILFYISTTSVAAGGNVGASVLYYAYPYDLRYTFNITTTTLTAQRPVYLVVTPTSNGMCKIASTSPLAQTLPSTADGNWYIFLGRAYSGYQMMLHPDHPVYMHDGTTVHRILPQDAVATSVAAGLMSSADKTKLDGVQSLYRQFWTSATEMTVDLSDDGKTYNVWCAGSSAGTSGTMADSTYGCFIVVSNGDYYIQHKGSGITVSVNNGTMTVTSSSAVKMGIVEI